MRKQEKRSDCPISYSLDLFGDKWVLLILRDLALNNKHFYKDFLDADEGMATNVLSDRLKMLEAFGIIKSEPYEHKKTMKYYSLTEKGIEVIPVIIELWTWGAKHDPHSSVEQAEIDRRLANKEGIIQDYSKKARNPS